MQYLLTTIAATTIALLTSSAIAQTPPNFSPSAVVELGLTFGNTTITPGLQIGINVPASAPSISATTPLSGTYLLAIVDPDAPTPSSPTIAQYLHWLQPSLTFSTLNTTTATFPASIPLPPAIVPFTRPQPPSYSAPHRYIAFLFAQPANFTVPTAFQNFSAANRSLFNVSAVAAQAGLGTPVAGNYFLVGNMTVGTGNASTTTTGPAIPTFTGGAVGRGVGGLGVVVVGAIGWAVMGL